MSSIVLKVVFNGSAHRFTLAKPSMSDLIAQLKLSYPNLPADANIKYEDDENELITISTDNELMEAFNVAVAQGNRTLKLIVSTTSTPSSSNVEDNNQEAKAASASRAASPSRAVSPPRVAEPVKVSPTPTSTPKPAASAASATPKPETPKPTAQPAAQAPKGAEESKLPGREEIVDLLLSLVKNTEFQAILPQVLNAVLDEVTKPQRSVKTIVDRVLSFAPIRDHVFTARVLPFLDQVLPCAEQCLSRVNPALVAMARPLIPLVATMIPSAIAFLERLKAAGAGAGAGAGECPLGGLAGLAGLSGLFGGGAGPCGGLAGLAKMFGPPTTTPNGDVEFDLGAIPLPPFLAGLFEGLGEEEGDAARAQSQPRGGCGPCGPRAGPCGEPSEGCPRSQSVPRGGFGFGGCPRGFGGPRGPHGFFGGPHGPHGFGGPHGPHGFGGPHHGGPHGFGGPHHGGPHGHHGRRFGGGRHHPRHPFAGPFGGGCTRGAPAPEAAPTSPTAEGEPHVWRNFSCDGCSAHPIQGIRYHCTICKDFDLCEACEAKGVHPRHHPLIKLHVPRPPPSDEQAIHHGVTCDMCRVSPITGLRYRCTVCPDFDMCEKCEAKRLHPAEHPVIKLRTERHLPPQLPSVFQGEGGRPEGGCPRRGGGRCGGRWRRWEAAMEAANNASSATSATSAESKTEQQGCPMFATAPCATSESVEQSVPQSAVKGPQATLLRHVSVPHGSKLEQGQVLVKTWSVQNNGVESWPETTKLIFLRGDRELLGETEEFSTVIAQPGQSVEVSVPITTPTKAGNYTAYFQLADANRNVFGPRLWLEVVVARDDEDERKLASAPTASSSFAPVSSLPVDTSGWIDVKVETSPVVKPVAPVTAVPAATLAPAVVAPVPVAVPVVPVVTKAPSAPVAQSKYAAQLASLSAMGFNNAELNSFLLEKHNGDIQQVSNWLLENMNH